MVQSLKILGLLTLAGILTIFALIVHAMAPRIQLDTPQVKQVATTFEECVAAGNPVMESYPRQCISAEGRHFVEDITPPQPPTPPGLGLQVNGCAVAGCSGQLCVSADEAGDIVTTCEYRAEYACYQNAACEPQADGKCGWTPTPELQQCLATPSTVDDTMIPEVR